MVIGTHYIVHTHGNADALSRKVGGEEFCSDFVGERVGGLPCGGCKFCSKMQDQTMKLHYIKVFQQLQIFN